MGNPWLSFHVERAWETSADASRPSFLFCGAPLRRRRAREETSLDSPGKQACAEMPSPNGDTRAQVVVAYQGHPVFICAQCATVIVRGVYADITKPSCANRGRGVAFPQALQDELISKAFSGRDGRG